ncbi:PUB domain containing protein [Leishmania braziliensis]|nr:PUB domain containing protein [Leishmania braziliensis]
MSSEERETGAPNVSEPAALVKLPAEISSSSEDSDSDTYAICQSLFDALVARGFSENAIKKSIVAGCIDEATCTQWIQMHEGHAELDTALEDGVKVIIKAKRVLTEAEREAKVMELQERVRRNKEEERLELQRKERERLEMGRRMVRMKNEMEEVRRKMNVEEAQRENAADLEAKRRVKIQIIADRLERKGHTRDEALALAEKEFEQAAEKARAEAVEKLKKLQETQVPEPRATLSSDGAWNLSAITAASRTQNMLEGLFAGEVPACAPTLVDDMRKRTPADRTGECVRTLRLILGNIIADPFDTKKRTLRVSTKAFRDSILPLDEAVQLLRWCGFDLSTDTADNQILCLTTVVMRRLHQALVLLGNE